MGKTSKWFRSLLSSKKSPARSSDAEAPPPGKENKKSKWAFSKSGDINKLKNGDGLESPYIDGLDANKHAIAVAAATAAVAEAALAAAQAAAEVVRLTSGGGSGRNVPAYISSERRRVAAAIKIQSAFRAYLARRALRALKGLVKLQALVRGHIVRKQSADMLRRMQAMARIQARASASRSFASESSNATKSSDSRHSGVVNSRNYNQRSNNAKQGESTFKQMQQYNSRSRTGNNIKKESSHLPSNWLDHWMEQCTWDKLHNTSVDPSHVDDDRTDRILEIDTWKPHQTRQNEKTFQTSQHEYSRTGSISRLSSKLQKLNPSVSSEEVSSVRSPNFPSHGDQIAVWTAENSPRVYSASSRQGQFVPASDCSRSLFGDYASHPSYMANTESSRAKVRSQSVPKQRMQLDELGISSSFGCGLWDFDVSSEKGFALSSNYRRNVGLNSGNLKRQGTPARGVSNSFSSTYGYRF